MAADPAVRAGGIRLGARAWLWATVGLTAGAIVTAIALAPPASAPVGQGLAYLLFAGSSAHVASTAWFYTVPEVRGHMRRHRGRYLWSPLALIAGAGVIAALLSPSALAWLLLPYFGWQFFHYQKQNLGMASLAAAAHRIAGLRPAERHALLLAGMAGVAGLLAHPRLLQLPVGAGAVYPIAARASAVVGAVTAVAFAVSAAVFAVAVLAGLACLVRRPPGQRPAGFCAVYVSSLAFSLPAFLFSSPYAAVAGMTIAHGLQYLLLAGLVAAGGPAERGGSGTGLAGTGLAGTGRGRRGLLQLAVFGNIALAGGAILAVASDLHDAQPLVRVLYGGFLGVVMAHFVVDAGLWRLRDEFPRAFLVSRVPYLVPALASGAR